jgi:hypothetical protein
MNEKKNPTGDWFHIDVANAEQRLRSCEACAGDSGEEAGAVVVLCAFEILVCFECLRKFSESLRMFLCNDTHTHAMRREEAKIAKREARKQEKEKASG